jgi:hypothetical protein
LDALEASYYWSKGGVDRFAFLRAIIARLARDGWQNKLDTGWNEYDAEVFGNRWSRLRLTTVAEELAEGKMIFRCRLRASWSLRALFTFWIALGAELLLIGFLDVPAHPADPRLVPGTGKTEHAAVDDGLDR